MFIRTWTMYLGRLWAALKLPIARLISNLTLMLRLYRERALRKTLPQDFWTWRGDFRSDTYFPLWDSLRPVFSREGFTLWDHDKANDIGRQVMDTPSAPGDWFQNLATACFYRSNVQYFPINGGQHALRGWDGKDYIASVTSVAGSNMNHLRILRRLASVKPDILLPNNHILPIVREIVLDDIIFTVSPLLQSDLNSAIYMFRETSVEDMLNIIVQIFEAIKYIHSQGIAHRDLFEENFLVEWIPSGLQSPCGLRPRVYLIDFETAVEFPQDGSASERVCADLPFPEEIYRRPMPYELGLRPLAYCPFRLDIWQLGFTLTQILCTTGIESVDTMWAPLYAEKPEDRITAAEALDSLRNLLISTPPERFMIPIPRP